MKPILAPLIVLVAFLAGCAKNSDVEKLQLQIRELQPRIKELEDQQVEATKELRNRLSTAEAKSSDLQREVEGLKASESGLVSDNHSQSLAAQDSIKDVLEFEKRLSKIEIGLDAITPIVDAIADEARTDPLKSMKLEQRVDAAEEEANSTKGRVDNIVEILKTPPGPARQGMIDALP
ncbi:MAG: hypothetical protein ABSA05_15765 [Opitutaceae bacterium]|jgi:outer membrane murein-binding lipoprotein Lpp